SFVSVQAMIGERVISLRDEHADIGMDQEGPFVEQEDPMPDNIEGFFWKLNKHTNSIIKEKTGFEKTLDAAEYMFPRKMEGFFERYVDALKYQGCRKEGAKNLLSECSYQRLLWQISIFIGYVVNAIENKGKCELLMDIDVEPNLASEISNPLPLRPIPLHVCPPGTAVGHLRSDKDKRLVTISKVRKSPFIGRVVDDDGSLNTTKKRVTKYLFEVLEDHRSKESPFRMFLPTFVVISIFIGYVVNAIENKGKCELLMDIDVVSSILHFFITLSNVCNK
nr:C2 calcium-dependent membrane targeting [Tanacetum cinerariifolium]